MNVNHRGFTIIEMAIVMIIIGLLIGFGMSLVKPLTERSKRLETKETIKAASESNIGYAASNDRIPDWGDDIPDGTIDEFCEVVSKRNDAVSRPIYYFFDPLFLTTGSLCGRKSTGLTICRNAACTNRIPNVVFAVISGAEDYNPQTGIVTTGCPAGQICLGVYDIGTPNIDNCTNATDCPNYATGVARLNRAAEYDDVVSWVTLPELRTKVDCQGPQLKILNNELAPGSMTSPYEATIFAEGGIPFSGSGNYKWCLEIRNRPSAQGVPGGLTIIPNFVRYPDDASPTFCSDQPETAWSSAQADNLILTSGSNPLTDTGSFLFTVFVRDDSNTGNDPACDPPENNLDNCVSKSFVLTMNP